MTESPTAVTPPGTGRACGEGVVVEVGGVVGTLAAGAVWEPWAADVEVGVVVGAIPGPANALGSWLTGAGAGAVAARSAAARVSAPNSRHDPMLAIRAGRHARLRLLEDKTSSLIQNRPSDNRAAGAIQGERRPPATDERRSTDSRWRGARPTRTKGMRCPDRSRPRVRECEYRTAPTQSV